MGKNILGNQSGKKGLFSNPSAEPDRRLDILGNARLPLDEILAFEMAVTIADLKPVIDLMEQSITDHIAKDQFDIFMRVCGRDFANMFRRGLESKSGDRFTGHKFVMEKTVAFDRNASTPAQERLRAKADFDLSMELILCGMGLPRNQSKAIDAYIDKRQAIGESVGSKKTIQRAWDRNEENKKKSAKRTQDMLDGLPDDSIFKKVFSKK